MKKLDLLLITVALSLIGFGLFYSKSSNLKQNPHASSDASTENQAARTPSNADQKDQIKGNKSRPVKDKASEKAYIDKFQSLKKCLSSQDCDFPQTDPRSYELEVYKAINTHLNNVDVLPGNLKNAILFESAQMSDGFVKETVLKKIIQDKIYSDAWRDIVLNEYIGHHDSKLIPDTIKYLKEHSSAADQTIIHQKIFSEMSKGSPKVANALTDNIKVLLDKNSLSFYKSQLSTLQDGPIKNNLKREILDFEMMASAG